jgi:hypothetical protein
MDGEDNGAERISALATVMCDGPRSIGGNVGQIKIAKRPHRTGMAIDIIIEQYGLLDLISAICRMIENRDDGTAVGPRWDYQQESLPPQYCTLDIWTSFRIHIPGYNTLYPDEQSTIRCKPMDGCNAAQFDPVFVLVNPKGNGIHSTYN